MKKFRLYSYLDPHDEKRFCIKNHKRQNCSIGGIISTSDVECFLNSLKDESPIPTYISLDNIMDSHKKIAEFDTYQELEENYPELFI